FLGLSCMGWNALYITLSAETVPVQNAATAVGAGTTVTFIGMFAIPPVFGVIADHAGSYVWSWLALGAWALLGTVLALAIRDRSEGTPVQPPSGGAVMTTPAAGDQPTAAPAPAVLRAGTVSPRPRNGPRSGSRSANHPHSSSGAPTLPAGL